MTGKETKKGHTEKNFHTDNFAISSEIYSNQLQTYLRRFYKYSGAKHSLYFKILHSFINVFLIPKHYCLLRVDIYKVVLIEQWFPRVPRKTSRKKQLSQLNETLYDVIIGNGANVNLMKNETLEQQTNGQHNELERFIDQASQKISQKLILTIESENFSTMLSRVSKIECTMRFWRWWTKWLCQGLRRPWSQSPVHQDMDPILKSETLIERISERTLVLLRSCRALAD